MANETTSKLTIAASGVGFESTASAVDTLAKAQQRLVDAQAQLSTAMSSGTIGEVGRLTDEVHKLQSVIDQLQIAQHTANTSTRDFTKLISQASPELARFVDIALSATKVSGLLAQQNISLANVLNFAKTATTQYAGVLALLGAGGFAFLGIKSLIASWQRVKEETERATEAMKRYDAALEETQRQRSGTKRTIEDISDKRREGGLSAAESESAADTVRRVSRKFPQLDEDALNTAAALLPGADDDAIAEAAFLQQSGRLSLDPRRPAQSRRNAFLRAQQRSAGQSAAFFGRESGQRDWTAALDEARGNRAGTENLEAFIASLPGSAFAGREKELASSLRELVGVGVNKSKGIVWDDLLQVERPEYHQLMLLAQGLRSRGVAKATESDVVDLKTILSVLERAIEKATGGPTVIQNNGRYIGADAASRRARTVNGESQRARIERE